MVIEINTKVSIGEQYGNNPPNIVLEDAKFYGRPNFIGEMDRFNDDRRKFTVLIPNDIADQLRAFGYNVKTDIPSKQDMEEKGYEEISHLKVFLNFTIPMDKRGRADELDYETGPDVFIRQNDEVEKLNSRTVGILDRSRFETMDMEIRAWEYNKEEHPGQYSARLVQFVGTMRPSILDAKYGRLR